VKGVRQLLVASVLAWLPLAALTVALSGVIYAAVQQVERSGANDPQVQMATDARAALDAGATPQSLVPTAQIDIAESYAPYLVIYDTGGHILAASATVHGDALIPSSSVFASAQSAGMDVITWTPEPGVRSAIVVVPYTGGYVLAGRSLRLVEEREDNLLLLVAAGGAATLVVTLVVAFLTKAAAARHVATNE
jgi:hypothetical protein